MNRRKSSLALIAASLVALIAFLTPAQAVAGKPAGIFNEQVGPIHGAPVQIESCVVSSNVSPAVTTVANYGFGILAGRVNSPIGYVAGAAGAAVVGSASAHAHLSVKIANESGVTADIVRVRIGNVFERDEVQLKPGDVSTRTYKDGTAWDGSSGAVACSVDWVHFTDGTTWSADGETARRQARALGT